MKFGPVQAKLLSSQFDLHFLLLACSNTSLMHGGSGDEPSVHSRAELQGEDGSWRLVRADSR